MILGERKEGKVSGQDFIDDLITFQPMSPPTLLLCKTSVKTQASLDSFTKVDGRPLTKGNENAVFQHFGLYKM